MGVRDRLAHAWNAFSNSEQANRQQPFGFYGEQTSYSARPDRQRMRLASERSILASVLTRMAVDVAGATIRHVRLDDDDRFLEEMNSQLNNCFKVEPNLDQGPRQFRQDIVATLFDEGVCAIVPVDTTLNPETGSFDVNSLRAGKIVGWGPDTVRVNIYNEKKGRREDIRLSKSAVAIVENPLYAVMNEPNSTLQRLIRKLGLLDVVDDQSSSGKMDMIIQLPYVIKSEARREQAIQRRTDLESQLKGSQYGVAYIDGTEKITQLNRPVENNLMAQIEYLTKMLYSQLGVTPEVMEGTADEATMLNYHARVAEPLLDAIVEAMRPKFLSKTARTQKQSIVYYRDPFKFVPISQMADISDKFARNEILSSNELRQGIGYKPSSDPEADKLKNSNMPAQSESAPQTPKPVEEGESQNGRS